MICTFLHIRFSLCLTSQYSGSHLYFLFRSSSLRMRSIFTTESDEAEPSSDSHSLGWWCVGELLEECRTKRREITRNKKIKKSYKTAQHILAITSIAWLNLSLYIFYRLKAKCGRNMSCMHTTHADRLHKVLQYARCTIYTICSCIEMQMNWLCQ